MMLGNNKIRVLINDFRNLKPTVVAPKPAQVKPILAERYDLRFIGKNSAKKLTRDEMESILEYGNLYLDQHKAGKFMTSRNGMADFEEAEAANQIRNSLDVIRLEIQRRM